MDMYQKREMRKNKKMNEDTKSLSSTSINWQVGSYEKQQKGCELCQIKIIKILLVILKKKL